MDNETEQAMIRRTLDVIAIGVCDAIRREVQILREEGRPIIVLRDGEIIDANPKTNGTNPAREK